MAAGRRAGRATKALGPNGLPPFLITLQRGVFSVSDVACLRITWDDHKIAELERLAAAGRSAREIAEALGVSRNAVIGKIHRLKLRLAGAPGSNTSATARRPVRGLSDRGRDGALMTRLKHPAPVRPAIVKPATVAPAVRAYPHKTTLIAARADQCRFPIGGDKHRLIVCGEPVAGASSYCAACHGVVYQKADKQ